VKLLEWRECNVSDKATDRAESMGQEYSVGYDDDWGWYAHSETRGKELANTPTRDTAKAAAQADYEARILSALEPAVQPDAAAIREAALGKALDAAFPIVRKAFVAAKMDAVNASPSDPTALRREAWMRECDAALELVVSARALIDNTGKEVMPDDQTSNSTHPRSDTGPGDQAVAGAAKFALDRIREWESDNLTDGTERDWHGHVGPALARLASTLDARPEPVAGAAPWQPAETAPKDGTCILVWWRKLRLWSVVRWSAEEELWLEGTHIALIGWTDWMLPPAGPESPPWPEGLIHLTNTRRFHVDCATEGCGRVARTRFAGRDYCEPCGRKVAGLALKGGA
jgi:hypothetical protein